MTGSPTKRGRAGRTNRPSPPPATLDDDAAGSTAAEGRATPAERSRSRSSHRSRHSPRDPKEGGSFKALPFNPKETRADVFVRDFEARIRDYYGKEIGEYRKRRHFYESLSAQQKIDTGCNNLESPYEAMKETFLNVFKVSRLDRFKEIKSIRMREGETVPAFANRLKYLLPEGETEDGGWFQFFLLDKLPAEAKTQAVLEAFEACQSFKEIVGVCTRAQKFWLSERSNKRPRAQVNAVQEEEEDIQEEEEQVAVNWVNDSDSRLQKSKRAKTDQKPGAAAAAGQPAATGLCSTHQRFGNKAFRCEGNCIFEGVPGFTIPRNRNQRGRGSGNGRGRARN